MKLTYKLIGISILFVVSAGFESSRPIKNIDNSSVDSIEKPKVPVYVPRCKHDGGFCHCRRISYAMRDSNYDELLRGMKSFPKLKKEHEKNIEAFYQAPDDMSIYSVENTGCEILLTQMLIEKTHDKVEKRLKDSRDKYRESGDKKKYKFYDYHLKELNKLSNNIGM